MTEIQFRKDRDLRNWNDVQCPEYQLQRHMIMREYQKPSHCIREVSTSSPGQGPRVSCPRSSLARFGPLLCYRMKLRPNVVWIMKAYNFVGGFSRFEGKYCLHLQGKNIDVRQNILPKYWLQHCRLHGAIKQTAILNHHLDILKSD
jgi:hypothetical protein